MVAVGLAVYDEAKNDPVIDAVQNHDALALDRALDAGGSARADVGGDFDWPVLFLAIEYDDKASVALLLRRGADPNAPREGVAPLKAARGKKEITRLLKQYGAQ